MSNFSLPDCVVRSLLSILLPFSGRFFLLLLTLAPNVQTVFQRFHELVELHVGHGLKSKPINFKANPCLRNISGLEHYSSWWSDQYFVVFETSFRELNKLTEELQYGAFELVFIVFYWNRK
jgi:hypothetical protein